MQRRVTCPYDEQQCEYPKCCDESHPGYHDPRCIAKQWPPPKVSKEVVYDQRIFPLMAQVAEICKEAGIAMIASFSIPTDEDPLLACTTMMPDEKGENGPAHRDCARLLGALNGPL